jgi:von Willebrand factor type A domain
MANYPGTPNNDLLQGTTADDVYTNVGVGIDNIKDPGGKNTIDISGATVGAIVDLSPGQTSTLATGSFTLGSLIVGSDPDIVFVADVSGSTFDIAAGVSVGDLNGDGRANTILDGEIAGFIALNQSLIDRGLGDTARLSLIAFSSSASQVGTTITPKTDANNNGVFDIVESLKTLRDGGGTDYEAAMIAAQAVFTRLATPPGKGNLIFLSDGAPNSTTSYLNEVAALKTSGYNLRAFGVGNGIPLAPLQSIDPAAATFTTTDQLVNAFTLQGGSGSSTETSIETFIGTNFNDNISGNTLSNKIDAGAGNDIIAGVNPKAANPGVGEIDTLTGGAGKDTFVLGDGSKVYYDDGNVTTPGLADYALITDFNTSQGDLVKLSGLISQYSLDNSPIGGISGQALFLNKPSAEPRELIAVFQNNTGLTLDGILGLPVVSLASGINAAEPLMVLSPSLGLAILPQP